MNGSDLSIVLADRSTGTIDRSLPVIASTWYVCNVLVSYRDVTKAVKLSCTQCNKVRVHDLCHS